MAKVRLTFIYLFTQHIYIEYELCSRCSLAAGYIAMNKTEEASGLDELAFMQTHIYGKLLLGDKETRVKVQNT